MQACDDDNLRYALVCFQKALEISERSADSSFSAHNRCHIALIQVRQGALIEALGALAPVLKTDPNEIDGLQLFFALLTYCGLSLSIPAELDAIVEPIETIKRLHLHEAAVEHRSLVIHFEARIAYARGKDAEALSLFQEYETLSGETTSELVDVLLSMGDLARAREYLKKLAEEAVDASAVLLARSLESRLTLLEGNLDEALSQATRVWLETSAEDEQLGAAQIMLDALLSRGRVEEARDHLKVILGSRRSQSGRKRYAAREYLARYHLARGREESGVPANDLVQVRVPNDSSASVAGASRYYVSATRARAGAGAIGGWMDSRLRGNKWARRLTELDSRLGGVQQA